MTLERTFRVAIFDGFLEAFAQIPQAQQKKVSKFLRLFREAPARSGINYESIDTFQDPNLRSVRIDQAYRAIVLKPETGNVYVLLWVDHHDKAYQWAENKRVTIHPETGSLQVLSAEAVAARPGEEEEERTPGLFDHIRDRELARVGVPMAMVPHVRTIQGPLELDAMQEDLPPEAFEALFWLSEGETLADVERAMAVTPVDDVDTEDYEAALERDASRRRFVFVEDDAALEAMLDAPLEKWRIFLHPSQRKLVERSWNGPVRVLGCAGTGKSVVAMHRAAYLAEWVVTDPSDRILFTTFTRNLALDARDKLTQLCDPDAMARIDVIHLDKWVQDLLQGAGYGYQVHWWGSSNRLKELWEQAETLSGDGSLPSGFLRDEWELVVQANGHVSWEDYKRASRAGRGTRLSRDKRRQVWPVFEEYRILLERAGLREPKDALRDARALLENGDIRLNIRSIVVDEAQDMSTHAFALLRAVIPEERPDDLFIVGDGHQRIYRKRVVLSHAGVNIVGRGYRLRINYRTTDEIRRRAVALLEDIDVDDLDAGEDSTRGYRSLMHGEEPEVRIADNFAEEVDAIIDWLGDLELEHCCLVARTNSLVDRYAGALEAHGIETFRLVPGDIDDHSAPGVRVATMHRVKGLEYDRMIIAGMAADVMPLRWLVKRSEDEAVRREAEMMERALLYVALTRARRAALVTAHGQASAWVLEGM